jgi:hypothetical protein
MVVCGLACGRAVLYLLMSVFFRPAGRKKTDEGKGLRGLEGKKRLTKGKDFAVWRL